MAGLDPDIEELHRLACENGQSTYRDPATGFTVFTAVSHKKRGKCCGNGCRHCPYGHVNVPGRKARRRSAQAPTGQAPSVSTDIVIHGLGPDEVVRDWPRSLSSRQRFLIRDSWEILRKVLDPKGFGGLSAGGEDIKEALQIPDGKALRSDHADGSLESESIIGDAGQFDWEAAKSADGSNFLTVEFYRQLFSRNPAMKGIFWRFNLFQTVEKIVSLMNPDEDLETGLRALAERHRGRMILNDHYDRIGTSLMASMELLRLSVASLDAWRHAWGTFSNGMKVHDDPDDRSLPLTEADLAKMPKFSAEEVARHAKPDDCWIIVNGRVLDVSKFVSSHPGGERILVAAGKDGTRLFLKNFHSQRAHNISEGYVIGTLGD